MPTVLDEQGFSFSFYAGDGEEPPHIHVHKAGHKAKWWLDPIEEARNQGFNRPDRARIRRIIQEYQGFHLDEWNRFFSED